LDIPAMRPCQAMDRARASGRPMGRYDAGGADVVEGCRKRKTPETLQRRRGFDVNLPLGE
jgi:hypothetical protein